VVAQNEALTMLHLEPFRYNFHCTPPSKQSSHSEKRHSTFLSTAIKLFSFIRICCYTTRRAFAFRNNSIVHICNLRGRFIFRETRFKLASASFAAKILWFDRCFIVSRLNNLHVVTKLTFHIF
jgi:hypothetical protein